jgi:dTDP-glucose pyrophosphorylase
MKAPKPVVLILAAGSGSRFGGLKQLNALGPNGETLMDYIIYDSLKVGFEKIIIVVKEEMIEPLQHKYVDTFRLPVDFCIQEKDFLFQEKKYSRTKPWGTAFAVYCARKKIYAPFLVVNADDFYGAKSFDIAFDFLIQEQKDCAVAFPLQQTLSIHGTVNRAEMMITQNTLTAITERTNIYKSKGKIWYDQHVETPLGMDTLVSMNMWGLTPDFFKILENQMKDFVTELEENSELEYQLPTVINTALQKKNISIEVLTTTEQWIGITYKNDSTNAMEYIKQKNYPSPLW